jgi:serine/threonine-protein kinase
MSAAKFCGYCGGTVSEGVMYCPRCGAAALQPEETPPGADGQRALPVLADTTYQIVSELGSGGGGVVYKAWHARLQKYVVLKRIKDESGLLDPARKRAEVDILKNLRHTNLPQIYDFITDESGVYTVIDFIAGASFAELLSEGHRFSQKDVVAWAEKLSAALEYLHGQKPPVLHSDIKPANIMLTPEGDVCLIDFNVSLLLTGERAEMIGGSPGYASPEQYGPQMLPSALQIPPNSSSLPCPSSDAKAEIAAGQDTTALLPAGAADLAGDVSATLKPRGGASSAPPSSRRRRAAMRLDARSDMYSFGATLYHLLTGEKPAIATGQIKPLSAFALPISEASLYIVERCMERDPQKRFQSAAELHKAIADIHKLDGRWKRHRARSIAAAAVLALLFTTSSAASALGWQRLGAERAEAYNNYVLEIAQDPSDEAYEQAVALFPEKVAAYREQALKLCAPATYEACIAYVQTTMAKLSAYTWTETDLKQIGDVYYVQGNSYFELEDYPNALGSYEAAIANNPDNPEISRDCAIALARCGYIARAEAMLRDLETIGLDSIDLLRGELAYARGDTAAAIALFEAVIRTTDDDYVKNRAYLISDKAYRRMPGRVGDEIALLRRALPDLPANYALVLNERLADALVRAGMYQEAVILFEQLRQGGNLSYQTGQNIGVLYQQIGDFVSAQAVFTELAAAYPGDYRAPMRLAYLAFELQAARANKYRDYSAAVTYYETARSLYAARPQSAGDDVEMLQLDHLITELRQNGWV